MKNASDLVIENLHQRALDDPGFTKLLVNSLTKARKKAEKDLAVDLFDVLQWPTDLDGYVEYLTEFSKWVPRQSSDPAWLSHGTDEHQEVYDRLCHFYWLIDQNVGDDESVIVENIDWFSDWLIDYARNWGSFLNTTNSFSDDVLQSFIDNSPEYRVQDSLIDGKPNNPSGWLTFNQFFARELNPGLRPIASPTNNGIATSPADCTYKAHYSIDSNSKLPDITVKKTHEFASIPELLGEPGKAYKDAFANGTFVHYFLGPYSYHRFHTPVAGRVVACYALPGEVYLSVELGKEQFQAPDDSEDGYEFTQARGVIIIDTTESPFGNVGLVAVIPVGMAQVSSVNMTASKDTDLLKGDEFGYFLFGGSDNIVLYQESAKPDIVVNEDYRHYGTKAATCSLKG